MKHTRIAVALGVPALLAPFVLAPLWVLGVFFGVVLFDIMIVALLYRRGQLREAARQDAAERPDVAMLIGGGVPFHTDPIRTSTERHHAK